MAVRPLQPPSKATTRSTARTLCSARQSISISIVEQDHQGVKRITRPMLECKSCDAAQSTPVDIDLIHMLHKGQMDARVGDGLPTAVQFYSLATSSPSRQ